MKLTRRHPAPGRKGAALTKAAGWTAVAFGAAHVVVAPFDTREGWSKVADDGFWNAFTLDRPTSLAESERAETFWVTLGSFGAPVLVLGGYVLWSARQRQRVPGWVGWALVAWGVPLVVTMPASPGWAVPVMGGLIVAGDRHRAAN